MSDAMHFAEELTGRYRDDRPAIPAIVPPRGDWVRGHF